ncbi:MAG: 3-(cis-5,6-dihydroxycyclohexa-1,3-dien-1-yl)propanoate dehydrogenase [Carbonactinosporaceae bacterium]
MGLLDSKSALVIGGGSGIGRGVAEAFSRHGARTAVMDLSADKCDELRRELPETVVVEGDSTSLADCRAAVDTTRTAFGGLDVLVNCVGLFDFYSGLDEIDDDVLDAACDEAFSVNVKSHLVAVKTALPALRRSRGSVILTTSTSGFYPGRGGVLYVASKFAVRGVVISLAHELAPDVRVNGVAPGGTVGTDLRGLRSLGMHARRLADAPDREAHLRSRTPLAVALSPADLAGSYVFLASDLAAGTTGTFLHPDGGIGVKA